MFYIILKLNYLYLIIRNVNIIKILSKAKFSSVHGHVRNVSFLDHFDLDTKCIYQISNPLTMSHNTVFSYYMIIRISNLNHRKNHLPSVFLLT